MKDLSAWLTNAGCQGVRTYIQSGNVVFRHDPGFDAQSVIAEVIRIKSGFEVSVIVRSDEELARVEASTPFPINEPAKLHVGFLNDPPLTNAVAAVDAERWAPEQFAVAGRDLYLYLVNGTGNSKLVPQLKLLKAATVRNWNTVVALNEMMAR